MSRTKSKDPDASAELAALRARVAELEQERDKRIEVERALRASELRFRVLYEETPAMYFTVDTCERVLSVNPFGAEQLGYTVAELLNQPVLGVFHEEDKSSVREQLARCLRNPGQAFDWEFRKVRKDGSVMWVREVARAVQNEAGETVVLIVCENINRRRKMEADLRRSRERYHTLYTRTPVMLHSIGRDGRLLDVNDYWLETLGYSRGEVIGRKADDFCTEASRIDSEKKLLPEIREKGFIREMPIQLRKKNGEVIDALLSAIAERSSTGEFKRTLAVLVDVTQQKRAEERLRRAYDEMEERVRERTFELEEQRRYLRQVIDVDPNFIFAKDREGRFTLVNQAVADVYGRTPDELIGKMDKDFNPNEEEVARFRRDDKYVMETGEELVIEEETVTSLSGDVRILQTVKRPLRDRDGNVVQVLGSATNITLRKHAERQARESEAALRASKLKLEELAAVLINAQEEERRRVARDLHDDVGQRLVGIGMFLESLEPLLGKPSREAEERYARIRSELERLKSDLKIITRGLHAQVVDKLGLEDAIRAECDVFSSGADFSVEVEAEKVPRRIPSELATNLFRITQESLRNAVNHSGAEQATVALLGKNGAIELEIRDEGRGFDVSKIREGKGIGLSSMHERARIVGADLQIESEPGKGTRIRVRAPLPDDL